MAEQTSASSEYSDLDDYHLVGLYLERRDERAFSALYSRYTPRLVGYARRKVQDGQTAEDLVADTWRKVTEHLHRYDPEKGEFSTWVHFILSNLVKNEYRNRERRPRVTFSTLNKNHDRDDREVQFEDASRTPERAWEKTRARALVAEAVLQLRPHHRAAFVLVNLRGWSYKRTAKWLGLPLGTIKSRVHRGEKVFVEAFEKLASRKVTPREGRVRVTAEGRVRWARPEEENGASPWSLRNGREPEDEVLTPDEIRTALRAQGWTLDDGQWRTTSVRRRPRVFVDDFVDEHPDLVSRWFVTE